MVTLKCDIDMYKHCALCSAYTGKKILILMLQASRMFCSKDPVLNVESEQRPKTSNVKYLRFGLYYKQC